MPQGMLLPDSQFDEPSYRITAENATQLLLTFDPNTGSGAMKLGKEYFFFNASDMELIAYMFGSMATNCRKAAQGLSPDSQIHPFNSDLVRERWPQLSIPTK